MSKIINFEEKKAVVFNFILNFFRDKAVNDVNIPYFIEARDFYNENVRTVRDLNTLYKKILSRTDTN